MNKEKTRNVVKHILSDRNGADYYHDVKILSDYLKGALVISKEKANHIANLIHEDREGADYYKNVEILTKYLESEMNT
jgi:hypothetical protein